MGKSFKRILAAQKQMQKVKAKGGRLLALALALVMCLSLISVTGVTASAAAISLAAGDKVRFGGEIWRVIDADTVANDRTGQKGVLLLSEYVLHSMQWDSNPVEEDTSTYQSRWDNSEVRAYLKNDFEGTINMTAAESAAVLTAVKDDYTTSDPAFPHRGNGLTNDRFFLFNSEQALYTDEYFTSNDDRIAYDKASGEPSVWWLRSSFNYLNATEVGVSGWFKREDNVVTNTWGVRPAFYLNPAAVASVSKPDANGVKTLTLASVAAPEVTVENEFDGIRVNWANVAGASNYEVLRKGADEETATVIATVASTSYTDSEALAGYKYYYSVKAVAADGGSAVSMPVSIVRSLYFGSYEQDNNLANGKEPIEWLVTKIEDGKMFLVSRYCLDSQLYNKEYTDVTWETCTLRTWLNNDFLNAAFSKEEQAKIVDTNVTNGANFTYKTPGGNNTVDKVFLLSLSEVRSVFPTLAERIADSTAYALAQGAYQEPRFGTSWYWTRTPGYTHDSAVYVCGEGDTYFSGNVVNHEASAVRPAMWIEADGAAAQATSSYSLVSPAISTANVADGVRVSWTASSNAVRYAVYRRTGAEPFECIAFTTGLNFVDKSVTAGNKYFYVVHAYDANGNYTKSTSVAITAQPSSNIVLTPPAMAFENTKDSVIIRWTSEPGAVEYKVYRKVNIIGEYVLMKTTTGVVFEDHDIVNGTGYYYKIRAVDANGDFLTGRTYGFTAAFDGSGSNEAAFEINAVNKEAGIALNWPAVAGVSQYTVSRKIVGKTGYEVLATVSANSYLDKTAEAGVKYSYKVVAGTSATATETISRTVFFGSYEQDNIAENGTEAIEWIVLDEQDGKMLLISRLNLDLYALHDEYTVTTWEESALRAWLNNEFLNNAFSAKEQTGICESLLVNEDSPYFGTKGGNNTVDKVFVLSMTEASKYFSADGDRQADTTEYAKVQGSYPNANYGTSWYWSRTPGYSGDYFTFVSGNGAPFIGGNTVDHNASAVRPAIWISKDALTDRETPAEDPTSPKEEEPTPEMTYTVVKGDCLWNIAKKFYGSGSKWTVIFEANRPIIKNKDLIYVGQRLVIPSVK